MSGVLQCHQVWGDRTYRKRGHGLRGARVRINAVCLGTIDTPMVTGMVETGDLDLEKSLATLPMRPAWHRRRDRIRGAVALQPRSQLRQRVALPANGGFTAQ